MHARTHMHTSAGSARRAESAALIYVFQQADGHLLIMRRRGAAASFARRCFTCCEASAKARCLGGDAKHSGQAQRRLPHDDWPPL